MIYLDSAATSLHRPESVIQAVCEGMQCLGNPGRGAYDAALEAGRTVYQARKKIGSLFGMEDPSRVVFTANVTEALNLAVSSLFGVRALFTGILSSRTRGTVSEMLPVSAAMILLLCVIECVYMSVVKRSSDRYLLTLMQPQREE